MGISVELCLTNVLILLGLYFGVTKLYKYWKGVQWRKKTERWRHTPKNKVIVHVPGPAKTVPNGSPFALKLLTYLRMAKIPFEIDTTVPFHGPSGKTPWISFMGYHMADSHLIIQFLNKKFDKDLSKDQTDEKKAMARCVRIMLENHTFWGGAHWRWIEGFHTVNQVFNFGLHVRLILKVVLVRSVRKSLWAHGIGRHSLSTIHALVQDDFKTLAKVLGDKEFICGQEPSEEDAAVFGLVAQALWGFPGSPYEQLLNSKELSNLKEYGNRMKRLYWPDWEQCLLKI